MDEFWAGTLMLMIFGWCCLFTQADRDFTATQQVVSNITYNYNQIAAKKGEISQEVFEEFCDRLNNFGEFDISLTAEKFDSTGKTTLVGANVIGVDLRELGYNIITIRAVAKKKHYLSYVYEMSFMNLSEANYRLVGQSSAYIE